MSCADVEPRLGELLAGALSALEEEIVVAHLVECAACGEVLAGLHALEEALVRPAARRGVGRWVPWWVAAAGLLVAVGVWAQGGGAQGGLEVVREAGGLELADGSRVRLGAGAVLEIEGPRAVRLLEGVAEFEVEPGSERFVVQTPRGAVEVLGTSFRVEVRVTDGREAAMRGRDLGVGAAVVGVAVATGVVLFSPDAGAPVRLEAGQQAVASGATVEVSPKPEALEIAERERAALKAENEALSEERDAMAAEVAALRAEVAALRGSGEVIPAEPGADVSLAEVAGGGRLRVSFGAHADAESELAEADWSVVGAAVQVMQAELLPKLFEQLASGTPPNELDQALLADVGRENNKLIRLYASIAGKLPTYASSNGEYSHPLVTANLLDAHLEDAGAPLEEVQRQQLDQFGAEYEAAWERQQRSYGPETFELRKFLDELQLKQAFTESLRSMLSEAQRSEVVQPEIQDLNGFDLYSPGIVLQVLPKVAGHTAEELREKLGAWARSRWELDEAALPDNDPVLVGWVEAVLPALTPVPGPQVRFFTVGLALRAGEAQLAAMQELRVRLRPDDPAAAALQEEGVFVIPRLVEEQAE